MKYSSIGIYYKEFPLDFSFPLLLFQVTLVITLTNIIRFVLRPLKQPTFVSHVTVSHLILILSNDEIKFPYGFP